MTAVVQYEPASPAVASVAFCQLAGGVSSAMNEIEADYALNWAKNIWSDTLA